MKTLTKCTLSAAVAAIIATSSAQAAEVVTFDPSLKLTYKNYKWDEDFGSGTANERDEWVQALIADFDTGYVNDVIGAVFTVGAVDVINAKKGSNFSNVEGNRIYADKETQEAAYNAEKAEQTANNIAGVQQAYLKAKYSLGDVDLAGSYGVKKRGFELFGNAGSRILAASSYGLDASASYKGLNVYASNLTAGSNRNDSSFTNDYTNDVRILGANYSIAGVDLSAEYLRADDFAKKHFLKAAYSLPLGEDLSADFDARYGQADKDGSDDESRYYNLNATLNAGNAYVGFGYNRTLDGDWISDNGTGAGQDGTFNSSLSQWDDYAADDEKAYLLSAGYNFADLGLPGLSIDLTTAQGKDKADTSKFNRREFTSYVSYAFDGQLEGLSVAWLHYNYKLDERADTAGAETEKTRHKGNRLYLTYSVSVF